MTCFRRPRTKRYSLFWLRLAGGVQAAPVNAVPGSCSRAWRLPAHSQRASAVAPHDAFGLTLHHSASALAEQGSNCPPCESDAREFNGDPMGVDKFESIPGFQTGFRGLWR